MAGHEGGILAYGPDIDRAMNELLNVAKSFAMGRESA
jgi:hypothetical protein